MRQGNKLCNMMSYEELCSFAKECNNFEYALKSLSYANVEIHSLNSFLDVLEKELDCVELANRQWKIQYARNPETPVLDTVYKERMLNAYWNYFNNEDCVPEDIGIVVIRRKFVMSNWSTFADSDVVVIDKKIATAGAGGIAVYHNRETNKCSAKLIGGKVAFVTYIYTPCSSINNVNIDLTERMWELGIEEELPDRDKDLGVMLYKWASGGNLFEAVQAGARGNMKPLNDLMVQSVNKANAQAKIEFDMGYCPYCGKDCYVSSKHPRGCNEHANNDRWDNTYHYIDYINGKFILSKKENKNTVINLGELDGIYATIGWLYVVDNANYFISEIKRCKQCGNNFVITKTWAETLKAKDYNMPCKCSKCRGKSVWYRVGGSSLMKTMRFRG